MRPANELVESRGLTSTLASEDEEYLIYFVNGGSVKLSVPACEWELLDPRMGKIPQSGKAPAGEFTFAAPPSKDETGSDWVLHIRAKA